MKDITILFLLFLATFVWGVGFPISKIGIHYMPPFTFAFLRFFITSILFLSILYKKEDNILNDLKKHFIGLSIMGLSGITVYNFFYLYSLKFTLASNSALIAAFNPIITTILAAIILKETINIFMGFGIFISLFGVMVIISHGSLYSVLHLSFNIGDLFMLIATLLWAIYSISGKKVINSIGHSKSVALSTFLGTLYLIPFVFIESGNKNIISYPLVAWMSVLYMAFIATFFAFSAWYRGVERFGASKTSIFVNLVPVFGVIASSFMLSEKIALTTILGGALVIIGVIITNRTKTKAPE
jgi:drug/metabolite transporter (DMT)-like permease